MKLPRALARFNRVVTNPVQGTYAWLLPPWAVVIHRGRRSGRSYRTPVQALKRHGRVVIAILYGEESDWVRNLLAAQGGQIDRGGRRYELLNPRVVDAREPGLRPLERVLVRIAGRGVVAELGPRMPRR
jgi:deazaflavin-dependent oxidoreductase (nitroreductase family)